ncbi:MAG: hypothetical protein ABSG04_12505 [Verrucomicrobiota bacterium]|jgi:hypothetical protein
MNPPRLQRYVPLLVWMVVLAAFMMIGFRIISYGFVPGGDARRHVAKVMTDREYNQIIVLRPEYKIDHSPGWDWVLRQLHRATGWDEDGLMSFSVVAMMWCVYLAGLPWLRRPEAWMGALLAQLVALPNLMVRLDQGRPFLLSEGVFICILFAWGRERTGRPTWIKLGLTTLGFALSVWVHGAWYLWAFVLAGFFMAGAWRETLWLAACWAGGVAAGALLTGKPAEFLYGAVYMAAAVFQEHAPKWMLVGEFQPSDGEFYTLAILALVYIWRRQQGKETGGLLRQPVFWMIAIFWTLGFEADRFWADWGMMAATVWLAIQFDDWLAEKWPGDGGRRLLLCGLLAAPLYLGSTSDLRMRYTQNQQESVVDASNPDLQGWLPEGDGIFYNADMAFFYNTFYKNPNGNWRYIQGFEPALMPEEDLKILRNMQWNHFDLASYKPWITKMRPQDRLEVPGAAPPPMPELEWHAGAKNLWIGRKPAQQ